MDVKHRYRNTKIEMDAYKCQVMTQESARNDLANILSVNINIDQNLNEWEKQKNNYFNLNRIYRITNTLIWTIQ